MDMMWIMRIMYHQGFLLFVVVVFFWGGGGGGGARGASPPEDSVLSLSNNCFRKQIKYINFIRQTNKMSFFLFFFLFALSFSI